ncbi:helix-turn-helix domain-containing protein [Streptomyces sp. NPDC004629]|uniref:helix-turn-helix domain-containing protein n=1 Tax=Streptomyces sp. NPDC004629 TaxID=3364705 RepID=UPI00368F9A2C
MLVIRRREQGCDHREPGVREESSWQLAGVSVDYILRLEQGRGLRPSADVVEALARALRLAPSNAPTSSTWPNSVPATPTSPPPPQRRRWPGWSPTWISTPSRRRGAMRCGCA